MAINSAEQEKLLLLANSLETHGTMETVRNILVLGVDSRGEEQSRQIQ